MKRSGRGPWLVAYNNGPNEIGETYIERNGAEEGESCTQMK